MSERVTIPQSAVDDILEWAAAGCPEGVAGMAENVLTLAAARAAEQAYSAHLVSKVVALESANARLSGFTQGIISEWTQYSSDESEYEDGYEDALADCAKRARDALRPQEPSNG